MPETPLTIAFVAGEVSGDQLGADLIAALKARYPQARFVGIGGERMQAQGLESWYDMGQLSVMGFGEVLKHLPSLLKLRKQLIQRLLLLKPDLFIGIDAPDFNFKVEGVLKQAGILTVHYVGPSVWAWREKRLLKIKDRVNGVLLLFPFEPPLYEKYAIPAAFVGHSLGQKIPFQPDRQQARQQLGLQENTPVTALLPGSRMGEVTRILPEYLEMIPLVLEVHPQMQFVLPTANARIDQYVKEMLANWPQKLPVEVVPQGMALTLQAADQAVVFSGTAALEAALYKVPMLITAKVHPLTFWIARRLVKTPWVGLPNVLAGQEIVPELIQDEARAERLAIKLSQLVLDKVQRKRQVQTFETLHHQLAQPIGERAIEAMRSWGVLP